MALMITYRNEDFAPLPNTITIEGIVYNGVVPAEELLLRAGYYPCMYSPKPVEGHHRAEWELLDGHWVQSWVEYTPEPEVYELSKHKLRKSLKASGLGDKLNELFEAVPEFREAWIDAVRLRTDDPGLLAALEQFKAMVPEVTDKLIQATFEEARI